MSANGFSRFTRETYVFKLFSQMSKRDAIYEPAEIELRKNLAYVFVQRRRGGGQKSGKPALVWIVY